MSVFAESAISPTEVLAADSIEFVIRLVLGDDFTAGPARLVFDYSAALGTSCPTRSVNEASGYIETYVSNPLVTYSQRCWDLDLNDFARRDRPPSREAQRMVVLDLSAGLKAGDTIELHWGETCGGFGPGAKVTSVVPRPEHFGSIEVRYFEGRDRGLPDHGGTLGGIRRPAADHTVMLRYRVVPRGPHHLRLLRKVNKALLVPHDMFWNVAQLESPASLVSGPSPRLRNPQGVFEYADKDVQIVTRGLPLRQAPAMDNVFAGMNLFWGDIHTHSCHSIDCVRRSRMDMTPAELMDFARDRAGLDFFAVTDHHQPHCDLIHHLGRERWEATIEDIRCRHEPGRFVVFPGFEFRCVRGDTAVVCNWEVAYEDIDRPGWSDIRKLWADWRGKDYMSIPHFHSPGGLGEGEWFAHEEHDCEPVLEIFSDHGSYEREDAYENGRALCKHFRPDRCGVHFLKSGYRYGFAAHSDDHKGHVGVNGVTAVFATDLTRAAVFAAYRARRVYATTNARIRLLFTANGRLMGSVLPDTPSKELHIDVTGENRLKRIELFRNGDLHQTYIPDGVSFTTDLAARDTGPDNWYVRVTQIDNHVAWSSPVWFE